MDVLKKQVAETFLMELVKEKKEPEMVRRTKIGRFIAERDMIVSALLEGRPESEVESEQFYLGIAMTLDLMGREFGIVPDPELSAWRGGQYVSE